MQISIRIAQDVSHAECADTDDRGRMGDVKGTMGDLHTRDEEINFHNHGFKTEVSSTNVIVRLCAHFVLLARKAKKWSVRITSEPVSLYVLDLFCRDFCILICLPLPVASACVLTLSSLPLPLSRQGFLLSPSESNYRKWRLKED